MVGWVKHGTFCEGVLREPPQDKTWRSGAYGSVRNPPLLWRGSLHTPYDR
jgi:hypothetical protein